MIFLKISAIVILFLIIVVGLVFWLVPPMIEKSYNKISMPPPYQARKETQSLHKRLFVADLHSDSLFWDRDLVKRSTYGHIDIPRAIEGNIALQIFAAPTKTPKGQNIYQNPSDSDTVTALVILQAWPPRTWSSLLQRALYMAEKLKRFINQSQGHLMFVKSVRDLDELLKRRKTGEQVIGGFLSIEGAHALEGELDNLDALYDVGFRMIGLSHFFDNEAAGSAHGMEKGGLTSFGRELVQHIQSKNMILDLAHASPKTIDDVMEMTTAPVVVSHTGVRGTCDNPRNISDDHVRQIAANGGVIGIGLFEDTVCGTTIEDTVKAMRYVVNLVGIDHVAIGSDFDGGRTTPIDVSGMALLTEALIEQGFSEEEITKIMGGNVVRVLRQVLPKT